jgi:Domain of unknown function (DUF932)
MFKQNEELSDEFASYSGTQVPRNLRPEDISYFYHTRAEDCEYGFTTRDLLLKDTATGNIYDPRETKGVFEQDNLRCDVTRHYALVPDQKVEAFIQPVIDSGDLKFLEKYRSKNGLATTWKYETQKEFKVKRKSSPDDIYGVQIVLRNSINGGVALSAAVRTLRQLCTNGLTAWGTDLSSKIAHYGDNMNEKLRGFRGKIYEVVHTADKAIALLERTDSIEALQVHIQYIIDKVNIHEELLPDYIQLEPKKRKIAALGSDGKQKSLYDITNDFTWKLSRADRKHPEHYKVNKELSFLGITQREQSLTKAVQKIVVNNGRVPQ